MAKIKRPVRPKQCACGCGRKAKEGNRFINGHTNKKRFRDLKSPVKIRRHIFDERGRKCERCGWAEKNPFTGIIPVQLNHIDGNRENTKRSNLEVVCPNCHSLTKHFMFYGRKHKNYPKEKAAACSPFGKNYFSDLEAVRAGQ